MDGQCADSDQKTKAAPDHLVLVGCLVIGLFAVSHRPDIGHELKKAVSGSSKGRRAPAGYEPWLRKADLFGRLLGPFYRKDEARGLTGVDTVAEFDSRFEYAMNGGIGKRAPPGDPHQSDRWRRFGFGLGQDADVLEDAVDTLTGDVLASR